MEESDRVRSLTGWRLLDQLVRNKPRPLGEVVYFHSNSICRAQCGDASSDPAAERLERHARPHVSDDRQPSRPTLIWRHMLRFRPSTGPGPAAQPLAPNHLLPACASVVPKETYL